MDTAMVTALAAGAAGILTAMAALIRARTRAEAQELWAHVADLERRLQEVQRLTRDRDSPPENTDR